MASISGLSVRVSAATAGFQAGMSRVEETAQDAALALRRLSFSSESAESNLDEVGRSAIGASGGMVAFGASTEGAGFSVRGLSSSILVSLVPALATLTAALSPVVAALGGLVAIAGAIGGIGLVSVIGGIATRTEMLKEEFMGVVGTVEKEFAPVFELAAQALAFLMGEFERIIPALVPAQGVMQRLAGSFVNLGQALIDSLPAFVSLATTLATEFLPPFVTWVEDVLPRVPGMVQDLVSVTREVLPIFMEFGRFLGRFLPALNDFGMVALPVVADSLGALGGVMMDTLGVINSLDGGVQSLIAQLSLVSPVALAVISVLGGISAPVIAAVGAIAGLAAAWQTNFGNIRGVAERTGAALRRVLGDRLPTLISELKQLWTTIRPVVEPIFNFLANAFGVALVSQIDLFLGAITALVQFLNGDFQAAGNTLIDTFSIIFTRVAELINRFTGGALESLANDTIEVLNTIGGAFEGFAEFAGFGDEFQFEEFQQIDIGTTPFQTGDTSQQRRDGGSLTRGEGQPVEVQVSVEGDTDVVRDVAVQEIQNQNRNTRRNQGRPTRVN